MAETDQMAGPVLEAKLADGSLAGAWRLDPTRSSVKLKTKAMWGLVPVKATFAEVEGAGQVTPEGQVSGTLDVKSASINTKMKKRDTHLRSEDFFAAETYPSIHFELSGVTPSSAGVSVTGSLTVRERTIPLSFPAVITAVGDGGAALDADVNVDRAALGLDFAKMGATKMDNTVTIHAVFIRA